MAWPDLQYGQEILYYALKLGGQEASQQDDYADIVEAAVRKNYWEILQLEPWKFALNPTPGTISTVASQSVTISSITDDAVTLSDTIATSMAGRKIYHDALQTVYRITAHTAGTNLLTLDSDWVETETSGPATIFQDEYDLSSNVLTVWGPMALRGNSEHEIEMVDDRKFVAKYNNGDWGVSGPPEMARLIAWSSSGVPRVQIAPANNTERNVIEYDYTRFHDLDFSGSGSGDTPLLPRVNRWVIAERAAWDVLRVKNNDLASAAWNRAEDHLTIMRTRYLTAGSRPQAFVRFRNNLGAE